MLCSLSLAELHSLFPPFAIPLFPCVAHIVLLFWTQYIYPSPVLVKARQLWHVSSPLSLSVFWATVALPSISHDVLKSTCYILDIINKHLSVAARITTCAYCPSFTPGAFSILGALPSFYL